MIDIKQTGVASGESFAPPFSPPSSLPRPPFSAPQMPPSPPTLPSKPLETTRTPTNVDFGNPLEEERVLISWNSPERPHKTHAKEFYRTILAIVVLTSIIVLFFRQVLLALVIWAVAFFTYVLAKTEPGTIKHQITTRGIKLGKNKHYWNELARFWFEEKWGSTILKIQTFRPFPGHLMLLINPADRDQIKNILVKKIPHDQPEETTTDRITRWLQQKIPLEEDLQTIRPNTSQTTPSRTIS